MSLLISLFTLLALGTAGDPVPSVGAQTPSAQDELLEHIVVVGASVSQGFGLDIELEVPAGLSDFIDAAWTAPHPHAVSHASERFFMNPLEQGAAQRDAAREDHVSLLVAVDYLFWFGYGAQQSEAARLERLELGLAMLDEIGGPMLVGDFPDMRPALDGKGVFGGPMINKAQIPEPATLVLLNARLDEWAKQRPNVMRVPLASFVRSMQKHETLELRDQKWTPKDTERLLQTDLLHATLEGTSALTVLVMDVLEREREELADGDVRWKAAEILTAVRAATEDARAKLHAKAAKREERMRKLEERKREEEKRKKGQEPTPEEERDAA